jgi:hypothetical protein
MSVYAKVCFRYLLYPELCPSQFGRESTTFVLVRGDYQETRSIVKMVSLIVSIPPSILRNNGLLCKNSRQGRINLASCARTGKYICEDTSCVHDPSLNNQTSAGSASYTLYLVPYATP